MNKSIDKTQEALRVERALKLSLEALVAAFQGKDKTGQVTDAIAAIREALMSVPDGAEQPAQQQHETDELIRNLGFDPERFRTEVGFINHMKLRAAIKHPDEYQAAVQPMYQKLTNCVLCGRLNPKEGVCDHGIEQPAQQQDEGLGACPISRTNELEIKPNERRTETSNHHLGKNDSRIIQTRRGAEIHTGGAELGAYSGSHEQYEGVNNSSGPSAPAQQREPVAFEIRAFNATQALIKRADVAQEKADALERGFGSEADVTIVPLYTSPPAQRKPLTFEQWLAMQHGDPEELGVLQALRIAYIAGQDSITKDQK